VPLVSVVISTRNRAALLARTLATVLRQREADVEVVVVDDCSTDHTAAMIRGMSDRRVRLAQQRERRGVSAARNRGIEEAAGEWVALLDDDDLWAPDKIRKQLSAAMASGRDWAYGGSVTVTPDLRILSGSPPPDGDTVQRLMLERNMVPTGSSNVIVRRTLLDAAGRFDTRLKHLADWDMWIRLALLAAPAAVADPVLAYVMHLSNASTAPDDAPAEIEVLKQRYRTTAAPHSIDEAAIYRWMAWHHLRGRRRGKAARWYLSAAQHGDLLSCGRALIGIAWPGVIWRDTGASRDWPWRQQAMEWLQEIEYEYATSGCPGMPRNRSTDANPYGTRTSS